MHTNPRSPLFILSLVLTFTIVTLTPAHLSACDSGKSAKPYTPAATSDSKNSSTPRKHPLKGVVTDLLPDHSALMVKHEAIPGIMKAMTMMLTVEPAALSTVKKGDAITALLYRDPEGTWRLDEVKVIAPATP